MIRKPTLSAMLMLLLVGSIPSTARADAAAGAKLAQQWCANCHDVDGAAPSTILPQGPPSFRIIAGHLNPDEMRAFLTHPHGAMPDLALTRAEIEDMIAYVQSLK